MLEAINKALSYRPYTGAPPRETLEAADFHEVGTSKVTGGAVWKGPEVFAVLYISIDRLGRKGWYLEDIAEADVDLGTELQQIALRHMGYL